MRVAFNLVSSCKIKTFLFHDLNCSTFFLKVRYLRKNKPFRTRQLFLKTCLMLLSRNPLGHGKMRIYSLKFWITHVGKKYCCRSPPLLFGDILCSKLDFQMRFIVLKWTCDWVLEWISWVPFTIHVGFWLYTHTHTWMDGWMFWECCAGQLKLLLAQVPP